MPSRKLKLKQIKSTLHDLKECLRASSNLFLLTRELLLSLHEQIPALPRRIDMDQLTNIALMISVQRIGDAEFPVYQIVLPALLPNKRRKNVSYKNALTASVCDAVKKYCYANSIKPFAHAAVFFVSYLNGKKTGIDNDNKESMTVLNGLVSAGLLRDDSPAVCDSSYCTIQTQPGEDDRTEILVTDRDHAPEVYARINSKQMSQTSGR